MEKWKIQFPGRLKQIELLVKLFGDASHVPFQSVFIYGHSATGKSSILKTLIEDQKLCCAWVNCFEMYNQRLLLESILRQLSHDNNVPNCDNVCDFIRLLKQTCSTQNDSTIYLVLDNAERLRNLAPTLLGSLFRLQELSGLNVCTVLVSEIVWEKFRCGIGFQEPYPVHFSEYTKDEVLAILLRDRPDGVSEEFFATYLNLVLGVFFLSTRDVRELRYIALSHFSEYCQPLESGEACETDVRKLWRHIEPTLRRALDCVYLRETSSSKDAESGTRALVELPFYSKFLLLAAYLASYNPPKSDRRFFLKNQGRSTAKKKRTKSNQSSQHLKGPKAFPLKRLLAIFYTIVGERVVPSAALFSQISSLVTLRLLAVSGDNCLNNPKYRCMVDLELIRNIARTVGFDIIEHLYDFT